MIGQKDRLGFGFEHDIPPVSLRDRFVVPPFSVLDARQGYWQDRKRLWLKLGIESEVGRVAKSITFGDALTYGRAQSAVTSIFDPVLCELVYRWFCRPGFFAFDPFAGGSVRGLVASVLGVAYTGIDLSAIQIEANRVQWENISTRKYAAEWPVPTWIFGDSVGCADLLSDGYKSDLFFSCPPYGNLEVYSDNPVDISTMEYNSFLDAMEKIVTAGYSMLRDNRFACFVVGDYRDKKTGALHNFPGDIASIFIDAGFIYYNEIILITAGGSLPIRAAFHFPRGRKTEKTHQNILVFFKGDPKTITDEFGLLEG